MRASSFSLSLSRFAGPGCMLCITAVTLAVAGCMSTREMAPLAGDFLDVQSYSQQELDALHTGREIYLRDCSTCHAIEPINRYTLSRWSRILPDMSQESKLTPEQEKLLTDYVMTMRRAMPDPK